MNAKEKAEELFDKFNNTIPIEALFSDTVEIANEKLIKDYNATKQCAIIAVDEIIYEHNLHLTQFGHDRILFWKEVK